MKRRVLSWILAGVLLFQSVNVEAAQFVDYSEPDQSVVSEETVSTDGEEELWMESLQDGEGLFQEGSFRIQERKRSEIALFGAEDEQWKEWDAYICEHLRAKEASIDIKDFAIPTDQLPAWYYGVINEHPELYFVSSEMRYMLMGNIVSAVMPTYQEGYDDEEFTRAAQEALSVVTEDMTDVQKAVALHEYLVINCEYDYENYLTGIIPSESSSAYGALVKGMAVCNGYALAYKYLLQEVGIPCYMVSSKEMNHAWNMVDLGGQLYQVDVTWDDPTWDSLGRVGHGNMFVSDKVLEERQNHSGWQVSYRGKVVDFQAQDTTYDAFFWTDVTSPLILWGGSYYYIAKTKSINAIPVSASASGFLSWGDTVQVYDNIGTWNVWGSTSYWTEAYSGLFLLGGRLYFNTPSQICSIKPDGTDMREEFPVDTTTGYIYGCAYRRGEVCYVCRTTPTHSGKEEVLTAELSGEIGVDKVFIDSTELRLFNGAQAQLTAEVSPMIATDKTIVWSSSDEQIATVSSEGMVTAVGVGNCTITAAAGGCSAVCVVTVVEKAQAYEVTFDLQGHGQQLAPVTVEEGNKLSKTAAPTEEGYLFEGWYKEAACITPWNFDTDVITSDTTLYAKWVKSKLENLEYTFTTIDDQTVSSKADGKVKVLFFFKTTYYNCIETNRNISEHMDEVTGVDIYALEIEGKTKDEVAEFKKLYGCDGITYSYDKDGNNSSAMWAYYHEFESGSSVAIPIIVFIDAENRLQHVTTGMRSWSEISADLQKYCDFSAQEEGEETYHITYELDGGTNHSDNPSTYTAETETILLKDAVKEGYTFGGWYRDSEFKEEVKAIVKGSMGDITIYAKWVESSINVDKVSLDHTELLLVRGAQAQLTAEVSPEAVTDKTIVWSSSDEQIATVSSEGMVTAVGVGNCTITAAVGGCSAVCAVTVVKTTKSYEVTFELQGHGQQIAPVTVDEGSKLSEPKAPTEEGYLFGGWYQEAVCTTPWNFDTDVITSDTTLYAKWSMQGIVINDIVKDEIYVGRIDLKSVSGAIANIKSKVYDGSPYTPAVKVTIQPETGKNKKLTLTEGTDYRVHYENCTNAGTATVVVEGNGNYTGTLRKEYTIAQKAINKCKVVTGGLTVNDDPSKLSLHIYDGNKLLVKGKDYDFSADKNLTAQKTNAAKVVVTGLGNYKGTFNAKFAVYEAGVTGVITPDNVQLSITSTPYTGKAIKVDDMLSVTVDKTVLEKNKQYSVTYKNNTNAGTAFVTITGKGGYAGKVVKSFEITPLSNQTLEIKDIPAKTYNGKVQTPAVTVKLGTKKLTKNKDYTLTYTNNLHKGKATVNITGKGNYAGTKGQVTFDIKAQKISKASVKGNREEGLTLTYSKRTLREGIDYSLSYDETSVNKNKIKVMITGLGDFAGSEVVKTVKDAVRDPAAKITPKSSNNKGKQNYSDWDCWASTVKSYLTANQDGTLMRVEYTGSKVWAETYQADESCIDQREIKMELPIFGGFYAGKDNYFLVFGKENPNENDEAEVIRVVKYGKDWKRQGAASLYGANTTIPFGYGSLRMAEYGGMLYVRTCHQMYKTPDGLNHQANLTFCVKTDEMRITDQFSEIMNIDYGYVSHSFNQFIRVDGGKLVAVDHGDAHPRSVVLVQYLEEAGGENFTEGQFWENEDGSYGMGNCINVNVLPIQGKYGANDTGVSVGGFEASGTAYLVAGNSVSQDDAASYDAFGKRNIFVTCTPKTAFAQTAAQTERESATTVHWITNYTEKDSVNVSTPQMVKLGDNEFLLLWTEGKTVKSVLLDGSGNPTTGIHSMKGALSDCQPILTGDSVTWYYTGNSQPVFCRLKISDVK